MTSLEAASGCLSHRGPDDSGVYLGDAGHVGFVQRRLSIIDLSPAGHQPMAYSERGSDVVINFNGEIYNYRKLRAECDEAAQRLRGRPINWRGSSDTEVLLWLYILHGADMLRRLDGMFALAIWDQRSGEMLVTRDRFGVKPLYCVITDHVFAFASEIKALKRLTAFDLTLDATAIAQYSTFLYSPGARTMFKAVRKVGVGEAVVVSRRGLKKRYQFAPPPMAGAVDQQMSAGDAIQGVRQRFEAAVQRQIISDVPIGAFLSGGLDSSSIVAFARDHAQGRKLQCFTIGHRGEGGDDAGLVADLPYAERVAKHLGVELHTVWVGPEIASEFPWMIAQLDEPQADPAALNAYFICKLAREHGIKVLLSGAGGDDLFSGYRRHRALMLETYWSWLPKVARKGVASAARRLPTNGAIGRRIAKAFRYADREATERLINYFMWLDPAEFSPLLTREFAETGDRREVAGPLYSALEQIPKDAEPLAKMLLIDSHFFLVDHNLNYTDKMSMAASVEVRVPFLDNDLADFAAKIPARYKQRGRIGKWVLKKAMEDTLPADVIYRPKSGFGVPLRSWMRHEMRGVMEDVFSPSVIKRRGIFDSHAIDRLRARDRAGEIDATYPILAIACIELWCRNFIDTA